ncbi:MAG: translation initiation factor IF-2 N-terminal domain-containing protein, partial [Mariprofundaceae bacterium]
MTKRILDLAKELGVSVQEVERVAVECNIVVKGPTSTLEADEQQKIRQAIRDKAPSTSRGGKKLTLKTPMVAGQPRTGTVEGKGRTVEVAVR